MSRTIEKHKYLHINFPMHILSLGRIILIYFLSILHYFVIHNYKYGTETLRGIFHMIQS